MFASDFYNCLRTEQMERLSKLKQVYDKFEF